MHSRRVSGVICSYMDEKSSKKKLILLGILALAVCILFFALAVSRMNAPESESTTNLNEEQVFFPTSERVVPAAAPAEVVEEETARPVSQTPQVAPGALLPWQTEVTDYRTQSENAPIEPVENESPFSIDDLSHLDLGLNREPTQVVPVVEEVPVVTQPPVVTIVPPDEEPISFPSMKKQRYSDCGDIAMPTGFGIAFFSLSAKNYPEVICLGEAIASSGCGGSSATILSEDVEIGTIYVAKRSDDKVCSVGAPISDTLATFCSVEKLMDIGTEQDLTMSQWRDVFDEDPGGSVATLYFRNSSALSDSDAFEEYDCKVYEI